MTGTNGMKRRQVLLGLSALAGGAGVPTVLHAQRVQADEYGDAAMRGAGSTFVQPLIETWVRQFRTDPFQVLGAAAPNGGLGDSLSNDGLDYEAVGSQAGIERIRAGVVDFAATEMPLEADNLQRGGMMQFPWVAGAVAVVTNLPGVAGVRLDAPTLAGIYLGRVTRWNDPLVAQQNPGVQLPDQPIVVTHRSDGSGTTFTFSRLLSLNDAQWKQRVGVDLLLKWPVGRPYRGTDEVVAAVKTTPYAIGYVNLVQAKRAGLQIAALRNAAGRHVLPDPANVAAAFAGRREGTGPFDTLPIDSPGERSYPLVATVFCIMRPPVQTARQRRTAEFVSWTLTRGGALAQQLGYLRLPETIAKAAAERLQPRG